MLPFTQWSFIYTKEISLDEYFFSSGFEKHKFEISRVSKFKHCSIMQIIIP